MHSPFIHYGKDLAVGDFLLEFFLLDRKRIRRQVICSSSNPSKRMIRNVYCTEALYPYINICDNV